MIKRTSGRINSGQVFPDDLQLQTVEEALSSLLIYEIGYGGRIKEVTNTKVVIVTYVMACVDTTTFEGTEAEMTLLVEAAVISIETHPMSTTVPQPYCDLAVDQIMEITKGVPMLIKLGGDLIMGQLSFKALMVCMIGDYGRIATFLSLSNEDLLAVLLLVRKDGSTVDDALELALAKPLYGADGKIKELIQP